MKRFIANGMLGKFCRWLRMLGLDTTYIKKASDEELINLARGENRTLLTSDSELYRIATTRGVEAFLVEGESEAERLADFSRRFHTKLDIETKISRCPSCNSSIRLVKKEAIKDRIPPSTFKSYRNFWLCTGCSKVYWAGSHWKNIEKILNEAKHIAKERKRV